MNCIWMALPLTMIPLGEYTMGKLGENIVKDCTLNPPVNKIKQAWITQRKFQSK